jgi:hypothetical protein
MKKGRIVVEKKKFDGVLKSILRSKPVTREQIKSKGKHGPKTPILAHP